MQDLLFGKRPFVESTLGPRFKKHGNSFTLSLLNQRIFCTSEPQNLKSILVDNYECFGAGQLRAAAFRPLTGEGILAIDGDKWKKTSKLLQTFFSKNTGRFLPRIDSRLRSLISDLLRQPTSPEGNISIEITGVVEKLAMESVIEIAIGSELADFCKIEQRFNNDGMNFMDACRIGSTGAGLRALFPSPLIMWNSRRFTLACTIVRRWFATNATLLMERVTETVSSQYDRNAMNLGLEIAKLFDRHEDVSGHLTSATIAGFHGPSALIEFALELLARNPTAQRKARLEILQHFGGYDSDSPEAFSQSALKNCSYLQSVLKETLRLYPAGAIATRKASKDCILPAGGGINGESPVLIRQGETVLYCSWAMHRRKDIWGPDAEAFIPERWQAEPRPWSYLPFSAGRRMCPGG